MLDGIKTLDDVGDLKGKIALVRIDINSSISNGAVQKNGRFTASAITIKELVSKGAKVVLLAHQGRPGDGEFRSLQEHAVILSQEIGSPVLFMPDICGPTALAMIKALQEGEVMLLDNVRLLSEEMLELDAESASYVTHVQKLASVVDLFVNDAFSVSHRSQASVIGFNSLLPSFAGRALQREIVASDRIIAHSSNAVFLLGGVKLKENLELITGVCKRHKAKKILLCGELGLLFLKAKGVALGEPTEQRLTELGADKFLDIAKTLLLYSEIISTPVDVAANADGKRREYSVVDLPVNYPFEDIGSKTIANYCQIVKNTETVFARGVPGQFENEQFAKGSIELGKALTDSRAFTIVAGGSWSTVFNEFKLEQRKISHVSLSGGAFLEYISGKTLPGIEALKVQV
ncbi:MAG: phosphoglycerate kinase [Candidatus Micrarchaeota archaeon]